MYTNCLSVVIAVQLELDIWQETLCGCLCPKLGTCGRLDLSERFMCPGVVSSPGVTSSLGLLEHLRLEVLDGGVDNALFLVAGRLLALLESQAIL